MPIQTALFDRDARELCEFGQQLIADGLAYGTAGNLSRRCGERIWITPSSVAYDQMTPDGIWAGAV